jgi:hypothetical protein
LYPHSGRALGKIASRQHTLIAYFRNYVDNYAKRAGRDISTFRELENALNHATRFLKKKYRMNDIPFSSLTYSFIEDYDYHEEHLVITKDLFLFSCFTGLTYVDLCNLSEEHLITGEDGKIGICIERQKSKTDCYVLLMKLPLQIIEKYRPLRNGGKLFRAVAIRLQKNIIIRQATKLTLIH